MDTCPSALRFPSVGGTALSPKSIEDSTSWKTNAFRSMAMAIWTVCSPSPCFSTCAMARALGAGTFDAAARMTAVASLTCLSRSLVAELISCAVVAMSSSVPLRNPRLGNHSSLLAPPPPAEILAR